jgi:hypothetical protein
MNHLIRNWHMNNSHVDRTLSVRFNHFKDLPIGASSTDTVNWTNQISWIKLSKTKIGIYINGCGFFEYPCGVLEKDKITIYDRSLLSQSTVALGKEFHKNVKYSLRWSEWKNNDTSNEINNPRGKSIPGQGWITCKNHKKEVPVGMQSRWLPADGSRPDITPLVIDYNYNLIKVNISKKVKGFAEEWLEIKKERRNRNARARYHNKKAIERVENGIFEIDDVFLLQNVSVRRKVIEHFGIDSILSTLEWKELDKDTIGGRPYQLIEVQIPDNNSRTGYRVGTYLRMKNPSTGETHFEGVPNPLTQPLDNNRPITAWQLNSNLKEPTVKCALAWRDNDPMQNYEMPIALT